MTFDKEKINSILNINKNTAESNIVEAANILKNINLKNEKSEELSMNELLNYVEKELKMTSIGLEKFETNVSFEIKNLLFNNDFVLVEFEFELNVKDFTFNNNHKLNIDISCIRDKDVYNSFQNTMEVIRESVKTYIKDYKETSKIYCNEFYKHFGKKYLASKETFKL